MGVDASASSLAPTPVKVEHQKPVSTEHHKLTLSERIKNIFNKPTQPDNSPHDTLVELANLDSPEDQTDIKSPENIPEPSQSKEETIIIDPQSETPPVDTVALKKEDAAQTTKDIEQVSEIIQQESTPPKVETVPETPKTLFPDSPPLYTQHHRAYEKEKRTIKGAITRAHDISLLRGHGKDRLDDRRNVSYLYDCLRSRGLSREQILAKASDRKLLLWQEISHNYGGKEGPFSFDPYYFAKGIKRLDSLGRFDPNFLDSPEKFSKTVEDAVIIGRDQYFEKHKSQLNQYIFLSKQNLTPFFIVESFDHSWGHPLDALSSLQKEYFSNPENIVKFNAYLDKHPEVSKDLFSFVLNRVSTRNRESIIPLIQALADSDINPGEKIVLPHECIYESSWYTDELQAFQNLTTRDQQRFLSIQISSSSNPDLISHYFNKDQKPNSNFFKDYIVYSYNLDKVVTLPDGRIIDSTDDLSPEDLFKFFSVSSFSPEDKPFFDSVLGLKDLDPQIFFSIVSDKSKFGQYFDQNHRPTSILFKDIAYEYSRVSNHDEKRFPSEIFQKFFTSNLTPELIATFSPEDQQFWKNILNIKNTKTYYFQWLFSNDSYLSSEGKITPQFLKYLYGEHNIDFNSEFISNLTPELIATFPPEDQQFWFRFINLKNQYPTIYDFMVDNQSKLDSFFAPDNRPNSLFFQEYAKYNPRSSSSRDPSRVFWITSNLTPELITTFSPEDQKLWANIFQLKELNDKIIGEIFESNIDAKLFFNENGQPTAYLFEISAKSNELHWLKSNLTPELITTFSPEDQVFWKFLLEKYISLEDKKKIISNSTFSLIINNREQLAKDSRDIDFLNNLIGRFSKKSEFIIKGYFDSLNTGVISKEDQSFVISFLNEFTFLSPNIIKGYKEARQNHSEKLFISNLKKLSQKLISSEILGETELHSPYYQDMIQYIYSNNSGSWASYESNSSCSDRSNDLSQFNIKDVYQIDLLSQGEILVKEGEQIDADIQFSLEKPVLQVLERLQSIDFNKEVGSQQLHQEADRLLSQINLPGIDLSELSIEDKLFIIVSESIYHHQEINPSDIKNLLITYEFITFEDIRNFIQGTNDRVSHASNQAYAHLCELDNFYSDRIKDVFKRIIESASTNSQIKKLLPLYFQSLVQQESQQTKQTVLDKLQIDKLGLTSGFIDQITKTLRRRYPNKVYTPKQVRRMLHIYETITQGLVELKSTSFNKDTQAFYGQFRSQRERTFALLKQLGSDYIDPRSIHLDEINLQEAVRLSQSIESASYNPEEFLTYTAQKFIDIFSVEKQQIKTETSKYISKSGSQREVINAYITKNKPSANARMVGGVCVSGDNPIGIRSGEQKNNQWDMPNYFQMIFEDPQTSKCLGLCLLHYFEENGKKILTVSFNPSSTYLFSVDEAAFFDGIFIQLQDFAQQNGFDIITTSQNHSIRTNRTGGLFEQAINKRISQIGKTFSFSEEKQFSYSPNYSMKDMDIIWENPK